MPKCVCVCVSVYTRGSCPPESEAFVTPLLQTQRVFVPNMVQSRAWRMPHFTDSSLTDLHVQISHQRMLSHHSN